MRHVGPKFRAEKLLIDSVADGKWLKRQGDEIIGELEPGGGASRAVGQYVTESLSDEASETGVVELAKSFALLSISVDVACWVRLYQTDDAMTADSARLLTEDPAPGAGVIIDAFLTEAGTLRLSPVVWGNSLESTPSADIPIRVTNLSGGSEVITVDFNVLAVE